MFVSMLIASDKFPLDTVIWKQPLLGIGKMKIHVEKEASWSGVDSFLGLKYFDGIVISNSNKNKICKLYEMVRLPLA